MLAAPKARVVPSPVVAPLSVCFVAPKAYPALAGRDDLAHVGGAERQQVLLAGELRRRGHAVSFVVFDHGQPREEVHQGIRLVRCYRPEGGVRGLRFFHPRLSGLWGALAVADADVYYQRGAEPETGTVAHWCRRHGRAFVFAVAHDTNCLRASPLIPGRVERLLFRYGLRRAHAVIAQTTRQQQLLRHEFGARSFLIRSSFAWPWGPHRRRPGLTRPGEPSRVLWVGRLSAEKRPGWVVRLARDLPGCHFDVVGQSNERSGPGDDVIPQLRSLANVTWHGYLPHHRMREVYRDTHVLLCTSESEGFPNVFLEAWACGLGVVTTVDPDGVVTAFRTGEVAGTYDDLRRLLLTLGQRQPFWEAAGRRGQQYVNRHHGLGATADALVEVLGAACARRRRAGGAAGPARS
jgi:glycosyltransferase involved in cell wall biosynthesis